MTLESSLHRQLKELYADPGAATEVQVGRYRIDVVADGELIEIQQASLSAIRDKIRKLLKQNRRVRIVKPIVQRKHLVRLSRRDGKMVARRVSPKRGKLVDIFDELVHFTRVFPHQNLTLDIAMVDVEELRYPGHGRRRWRRHQDFVVQDRRLVNLSSNHRVQTARDLVDLIPLKLPKTFHTGHLAEALDVQRWVAQRVAYCFREMGAAPDRQEGKHAPVPVGVRATALALVLASRRPRLKISRSRGEKSSNLCVSVLRRSIDRSRREA